MLVDERSSSREADRRFAERRRAGAARRRDAALLDADAAAIILERWLGS
jgi:putative Holliday junction resolvase